MVTNMSQKVKDILGKTAVELRPSSSSRQVNSSHPQSLWSGHPRQLWPTQSNFSSSSWLQEGQDIQAKSGLPRVTRHHITTNPEHHVGITGALTHPVSDMVHVYLSGQRNVE